MTNPTSPRQALGAYGETVALHFLVAQGMVLLDRNWRCDQGELDLVLRDGDDLVVCEVKARRSTRCGTPHEAVTPSKLARLRRLAIRWIAEHEVHPPGVRIDVVSVLRPARGPSAIEHVRGVA